MGKRQRNERTKLAGNVGFSKIRYCKEHREPVKAVRVFGKGMVFQCKEGCSLEKNNTDLRVPDGPQTTRR
jgi:hypothetical protein